MSSPRQVAVTSDQSLVADAVAVALSTTGLSITRLSWRAASSTRVPEPCSEPFDVAVMLCDLQPAARLIEAQLVVRQVPAPWVLVTGARRGPLWGVLLEAGVVTVLPSTCSLSDLRSTILRVAEGGGAMGAAEAAELRERWRRIDRERRRAVDVIRSLTPRERAVLGRLYAGEDVPLIAVRFGVSTETVRSQVGSVLRKLEVRTQLAAVAVYAAAREDIDERDRFDSRGSRSAGTGRSGSPADPAAS